MNAKPREEWFQTLSFKLGVKLFARQFARQNGPAGPLDVVRLWMGCVPEHHHCVADKFIDCSTFDEEGLCKHREIPRRLAHEHIWICRLGDSRKIPHVGENDSYLLSDSAKLSRYGI